MTTEEAKRGTASEGADRDRERILYLHREWWDANNGLDIPRMAQTVESMVRKSLDAFVKREPELARSVLLSDDTVDRLKDSIHNELVSFMQKDPSVIPQAIDLILVARHLERIADHATNIAEDTLFLVKGVDVRHRLEPDV